MYADIIIKNGRCVTMCGDGGADWVAAAGKMICAAGRGDDWQKLVRPGTQVIDARGGTVLPGFIDNHFHVMQTAVNMMSVDLGGARSHRELGEMLAAAEKREGAVLGCQVEESQFEEKRFPDRYVLDRYCSDSPVVLFSKEYHVSMLNTHALLYYKVPFSLEGVELDSSGLPTGIFRRNANYVLRSNVLRSLPDEFRMEAIHLAMSRLLENGITTVAAIEGGWLFDDRDAEFIYAHSGEFPVDMPLFYQTMDLAKVWKLGLRRVGGNIMVDGTLSSHSAALSAPYADGRTTVDRSSCPRMDWTSSCSSATGRICSWRCTASATGPSSPCCWPTRGPSVRAAAPPCATASSTPSWPRRSRSPGRRI